MTTTESTAVAPGATNTAEHNPHHARRWLILAVVALAQLIVVLDATIVNIALPSAQKAIGFSDDNRQWIVTAYALAFGSLLLLGGRLSDQIGRRKMFIIGLIGFAGASAIGGAATDFAVLVGARGLQGIFGAMLAPAALSLLTTTFTDAKERGKAFAIFGGVAGAGGAVGLILGGALTEYVSWRWCLYVNVPLAAIAVVGAVVLLKKQATPEVQPRLDVVGTIAIIAGLVSLVYGLANAESKGWSSGVTLTFMAIGVVLIAGFVWWETRVAHPLVPLAILLDRTRGGSFIAVGIVGAGMFGVFLFLTYYLSNSLGYAPLKTGLSFLPLIFGIVISAQVAALVVRRIGVKIPVTVGFVASALGMLLFTRLDLGSVYWTNIFPALLIVGLGLGFVIAPAFSAATQGVEPDHAGVASALVNTFQQIGGSIAVAALSAFAASAATNYLEGRTPSPATVGLAAIQSYHTAFWWSAGIFAAGAVICGLLLPHGAVEVDPDAEPVMAH